MRLLFVSMSTLGGSGRSQRELAAQLVVKGHDVHFLVPDRRRPRATRATWWFYEHLSDLSVRVEGRRAAGPVSRVRDWLGGRTSETRLEGLPHRLAVVPQNALAGAVTALRPDVVVVSSVDRWGWRTLHARCTEADIPIVLYVREDDSLEHLASGALPTLLVANAESLATELRQRGHECAFVPSVIDTSVTRTDSSREVALGINPVRSRGGDLMWQVAERLPDIPFVVQESWPLGDDELAEIEAHAARLPNVEFRRRVPPGPAIYADARVLLVPYRVDNRPRVILEAQANGIPVVVGDVPALVESIGDGGVSVPLESVDAWAEAVHDLWDDEPRYTALAERARAHSQRPEVDPSAVAGQFESLVLATLDRRPA